MKINIQIDITQQDDGQWYAECNPPVELPAAYYSAWGDTPGEAFETLAEQIADALHTAEES